MRQLLPDWFVHLAPPGWLPERAREFYVYTANVIPLPAGTVALTTKELVLSKKFDVLVFAGNGVNTDTTGASVFEPLSGTFSQVLVKLANPAGNDIYTSDFVPFENIFAAWTGFKPYGGGAWSTPAGLPALWPIPIPVRKGGSLQFIFQNLNAAAAHWLRISLWCALLFEAKKRRVA